MQLINYVLGSIQVCWSFIFIMHQKILIDAEGMLRVVLWRGSTLAKPGGRNQSSVGRLHGYPKNGWLSLVKTIERLEQSFFDETFVSTMQQT